MDTTTFKDRLLPLSGKLYNIAFKIVGETFVAEDMVQEAYIKLWGRKGNLDKLSNIEAFAVTILKNQCLDYLRTRHEYVDIEAEKEAFEKTQYEEKEDKEKLSQVMVMIEHLPPQQKTILEMRCIKDLSIEEIEKATGLTNINVRTLLSRARKKIRELCEEAL